MAKKKTKAAPKTDDAPQQFIYTGSLSQTRLWDGQTVTQGEPFTPRNEHCAKMCAGSALFKAG